MLWQLARQNVLRGGRGLRAGVRPGLERPGGRAAVQRAGRRAAGVVPGRPDPAVRGRTVGPSRPRSCSPRSCPCCWWSSPGGRSSPGWSRAVSGDGAVRVTGDGFGRAPAVAGAGRGRHAGQRHRRQHGQQPAVRPRRQRARLGQHRAGRVGGGRLGACSSCAGGAPSGRPAPSRRTSLPRRRPARRRCPTRRGSPAAPSTSTRVVALLAREHAVAVVGRRAVGTSSCAVQAANLCRDDFPDGQYYLDLRPRRPAPIRPGRCSPRWPGSWAPPRRRSGRPDDLADGRRRAARPARRPQDPAGAGQRGPPGAGPAAAAAHRADLPAAARRGRRALAGLDGVVAHWIAEPGPGRGGGAVRRRPAGPRRPPGPAVPIRAPTRRYAAIVELCGRQPRTVRALGYRTAQHGWRHADVLEALRRAVRDTAAPAGRRLAGGLAGHRAGHRVPRRSPAGPDGCTG